MTPPSASLRCRCFLGTREERRVGGAAAIAPGTRVQKVGTRWGADRGKLEPEKGGELPVSPLSGFGVHTAPLSTGGPREA